MLKRRKFDFYEWKGEQRGQDLFNNSFILSNKVILKQQGFVTIYFLSEVNP